MRRLLMTIATILVSVLSMSVSNIAFAEPSQGVKEACAKAPDSSYCKEALKDPGEKSVVDQIATFSEFAAIVAGVIAVIIIIFGGFKYVVSGGDPQKIASAKNTILFGLVGLIIVAAAQTLVMFIINVLVE